MTSTITIGEKLKLNRTTVLKYLRYGADLKWCDYNPKYAQKLNGKSKGVLKNKRTVQLSLNGNFIREWDSVKDASSGSSIGRNGIASACRGERKSSGGYKWMYKEDYEKYIEEQKQLALT